MTEFKIGQTVYLKLKYYKHIDFIECKIIKIGRKYIYIDKPNIKINLKTMLQDNNGYCLDYEIYTNYQQILDEKEYNKLKNSIQNCFDRFNNTTTLTLEQLRLINDIITKNNPNDQITPR